MPQEVRKSVTYIFFDGEFVKIGQSNSLEGVLLRLSSCQVGNARQLDVIGITETSESDIHERFASERVRGEWFRLSHEMLRFIASPEVKSVSTPRLKGKQRLITTRHV